MDKLRKANKKCVSKVFGHHEIPEQLQWALKSLELYWRDIPSVRVLMTC